MFRVRSTTSKPPVIEVWFGYVSRLAQEGVVFLFFMPPCLPIWGKRPLSVCKLYTHKSVVRDGFLSRASMTKISDIPEQGQVSKIVLFIDNRRNILVKNLMKLTLLTIISTPSASKTFTDH